MLQNLCTKLSYCALHANKVDGVQLLLGMLDAFCYCGLTINVDKTKMMVVQTIQPYQYHMFTYKGENVQFVQSFILVSMYLPQIKWSICFESRLQASWKS